VTVDDLGLDPALERLNYRNGQRIVAADLRAEQGYHIGVRRWLNRTLFNPGIAKGLEVTPSATNKHAVVVSPGLAIDILGRELIVAADLEVPVSGIPSTSPGVVYGNYLVIEFQEERGAPTGIECTGDTAPSRIRSTPTLSMQNAWPSEGSGRVPLAQIELSKDCQVVRVHTAIRKYASTSKAPKVRGISLEGEKDITPAAHKVLYFHVRGGYPESASLYLRASLFSPTAYSEVGWHAHTLPAATSDRTLDVTHAHGFAGQVDPDGDHKHDYEGNPPLLGGDFPIVVAPGPSSKYNSAIHGSGPHAHNMSQVKVDPSLGPMTHRHDLAGPTGSAGTDATAVARAGARYTFVADLRILLDGTDITAQVLLQAQSRMPSEDWTAFGDGTQGHALVRIGSGEIDLLQLAELGPGEHTLEFIPGRGGMLHYNLYVE
jgi:hypothetical protein